MSSPSFDVVIRYEDSHEHVRAQPLAHGRARLLSHAVYIQMAPGDIVSIEDDGHVVGVDRLAPVWTVEVTFCSDEELGHPGLRHIDEIVSAWHRATAVTHLFDRTVLVSSENETWLDDEVFRIPEPEWRNLVRSPGLAFDFDLAVRYPDTDFNRAGPWA